ncbi:MAG: hypothetical protein DME36_10780 [Verrucomicrobia bacterium]|nr:MAG: hypothetical protein DME36_10780 [Verrucomicrobiota bacterium]
MVNQQILCRCIWNPNSNEATVEVRWPSGTVDLVSAVAANSTLTVLEGSVPPAVLP